MPRPIRTKWRFLSVLALAGAVLTSAREAAAYRPFDGTDADVAALGEFELELGPAGYLEVDHLHAFTAPAVVLNFGVLPRLELVLESHGELLLDSPIEGARYRRFETGAFLKGILKRGVLQDEHGVSIATEIGPLAPDTGDTRAGASAAVIVSQRWPSCTVHVNGAAIYSRLHEPEAFAGVILEGPHEMAIRPVAEIFVDGERTYGWTGSMLVGGIWRLEEDFALDLGLRAAATPGGGATEVRLGFTWAIPVLSFGER